MLSPDAALVSTASGWGTALPDKDGLAYQMTQTRARGHALPGEDQSLGAEKVSEMPEWRRADSGFAGRLIGSKTQFVIPEPLRTLLGQIRQDGDELWTWRWARHSKIRRGPRMSRIS